MFVSLYHSICSIFLKYNIVEDIKKINEKLEDHIFYAKDLEETRKMIEEKAKPGDIILVMGAGDISDVADGLVA